MTEPKKDHGLKGKPSNRLGTGKHGPQTEKSVRLPVDLWASVDAEAAREGVSRSELIRLKLQGQG